MLTLIGLGLFDEKDLTLKGIEEAKKADKVYIELYTSKWYGSLENLEKIIGKPVIELKRSDLEENSSKIINEAKDSDVVIFVQGSPLIQTTHSALLQEARKLGIKTVIVHNASITSAIGETGLHPQRFGQYVTIPFPERTKGNPPESVFDTIKENQKRGLHTLCLLDIAAEENRYMLVNDALFVLLSGKVISEESEIVVFARAGSEKPLIIYDEVKKITSKNITELPVVVIMLGELHYTEKDFLDLCVLG